MSTRPPARLETSLPYVILGIGGVLSLFAAFSSLDFLFARAVNDDTFYYLQWAWNVSRGAGATFDNLHLTNGVQPLWSAMLTALAWISPNKSVLLRLALVLSALLNLAAGAVMIHVCRKFMTRPTVVIFAALFAIFLANTKVSLSAMEISVSLLAFALFIWWVAEAVQTIREQGALNGRQATWGGLALSLVVMARPDMLAYAGIPAMLLFLEWGHVPTYGRVFRHGAVMLGLPLIVLALYGLYNTVVFHSALPISGQFKQFYHYRDVVARNGGYFSFSYAAGYAGLVWVKTLMSLWKTLFPLREFVREALFALSPVGFLLLGRLTQDWTKRAVVSRNGSWRDVNIVPALIVWLLTTVVVVWLDPKGSNLHGLLTLLMAGLIAVLFVRIGMRTSAGGLGLSKEWVLICAALAGLAVFRVYVLVFFLGEAYTHYGRWYYGAEYLLLLMGLAWAVSHALETLNIKTILIVRAATVVGMALVLLSWLPVLKDAANPAAIPRNFYHVRYEIARDIERTLPTVAILAAWNAGQLGYFSERRVVNMDGLINGNELLEHYRRGRPVLDYLHQSGVGYVIDYEDYMDGSSPPAAETFYGIARERLEELRSWTIAVKGGTRVFRLFKLRID